MYKIQQKNANNLIKIENPTVSDYKKKKKKKVIQTRRFGLVGWWEKTIKQSELKFQIRKFFCYQRPKKPHSPETTTTIGAFLTKTKYNIIQN